MTGGGTGGHLAIVRAVKRELEGRRLVYVGSTSGQDRRWFGEDETFGTKYFLETRGVVNQGLGGKIRSLRMLAGAVKKSMGILRKQEAAVVFSVGGYSAAPTALAAKMLGIPLVIHEQNAVPGALNRLLKPFAAVYLSAFEEESPVRAYPIDEIFFEKARLRQELRSVLFLGGSQGAAAINRLALELAPVLKARGIEIVHQAGERHLEKVRNAYREMGIEAEVFGFSDRIPEYMQQADFAVARAGASTLWELAANGLPTLFIPYPYAAGDHQYRNAEYLVQRRLAWLMRESELETGKVLDLMKQDLSLLSKGLMELTPKDGSREIAEILEEYLR
ncbi:undecaprenyldiphospho-muramoylpentapeptide beta-N-acetylglucosaminyltransferase [Nitratifractor sp.]